LGAPAVVIALNHYPWWWTATGIGAALVLVLGEGAYRTWTDAMDRPAATAPSPRVPPLNHVHGLRDFATQQLGLVRRFGANDVDLESAQGRSLAAHYPELGTLAREWNELDPSPFSRARDDAIQAAARKAGFEANAWVLLSVASEDYIP